MESLGLTVPVTTLRGVRVGGGVPVRLRVDESGAVPVPLGRGEPEAVCELCLESLVVLASLDIDRDDVTSFESERVRPRVDVSEPDIVPDVSAVAMGDSDMVMEFQSEADRERRRVCEDVLLMSYERVCDAEAV